MGCGCNKNKGGPTGFVWTSPTGAKTETRSEIEAKALVVRQGGSYAPKK